MALPLEFPLANLLRSMSIFSPFHNNTGCFPVWGVEFGRRGCRLLGDYLIRL